MSQVILYKTDKINCAVVYPAQGIELALRDVPEGAEYAIVDSNDLPNDRYFRDAWAFNSVIGAIDVDLTSAKNIHLDNLRALREPLLKALDVEMLKAIEIGDDVLKAEVVQKKQALRDVTKITLSDDLEVMKTQIPDILK